MPSFAHTETVAVAPEQVFAIIDDFDRTPEWLTRCTGIDKLTDVTVDFRLAPMGAETSLTHEITIVTKGFGKLFTPMIKRALPRQTLDAMTKLKALAESGAA